MVYGSTAQRTAKGGFAEGCTFTKTRVIDSARVEPSNLFYICPRDPDAPLLSLFCSLFHDQLKTVEKAILSSIRLKGTSVSSG